MMNFPWTIRYHWLFLLGSSIPLDFETLWHSIPDLMCPDPGPFTGGGCLSQKLLAETWVTCGPHGITQASLLTKPNTCMGHIVTTWDRKSQTQCSLTHGSGTYRPVTIVMGLRPNKRHFNPSLAVLNFYFNSGLSGGQKVIKLIEPNFQRVFLYTYC